MHCNCSLWEQPNSEIQWQTCICCAHVGNSLASNPQRWSLPAAARPSSSASNRSWSPFQLPRTCEGNTPWPPWCVLSYGLGLVFCCCLFSSHPYQTEIQDEVKGHPGEVVWGFNTATRIMKNCCIVDSVLLVSPGECTPTYLPSYLALATLIVERFWGLEGLYFTLAWVVKSFGLDPSVECLRSWKEWMCSCKPWKLTYWPTAISWYLCFDAINYQLVISVSMWLLHMSEQVCKHYCQIVSFNCIGGRPSHVSCRYVQMLQYLLLNQLHVHGIRTINQLVHALLA